jgi:hypothetical protein
MNYCLKGWMLAKGDDSWTSGRSTHQPDEPKIDDLIQAPARVRVDRRFLASTSRLTGSGSMCRNAPDADETRQMKYAPLRYHVMRRDCGAITLSPILCIFLFG